LGFSTETPKTADGRPDANPVVEALAICRARHVGGFVLAPAIVECCIDLAEVMLDPVPVSAQNYPGDVAIGLRYLTGRFRPIQKPPNRLCLLARLGLRQNGLASFSETDVRQMEGELTTLCSVEQVGGGWSVMMAGAA